VNTKPDGELHVGLQGFYKTAIVDSNDQVIWEQPDWKKNLILNNGMDQLSTSSICACFIAAIGGFGTRQNKFGSSGSFADVQGTILNLTSSGDITDFTAAPSGYSAYAQVGDVIKFDYSGSPEVTVVTVNPTILTVSPSGSFATGSFTIWKTSQTGLQQEVKRTTTYVAGANGSTRNDNIFTHQRTWDFSAETASVTYNEVGTSWSATGNNNTFARVLLDSPISITSGQKMRLYYQILSSYNPKTPVSLSAIVSGWPVSPSVNTSGSQCIQAISGAFGLGGIVYHVSLVNANGTTIGTGILEAYSNISHAYISNSSAALTLFGSASADRSAGGSGVGYGSAVLTKFGWVPGSNVIYKTATLTESSLGSSTVRSMGFGYPPASYETPVAPGGCTFTVLLDQNQTKTNTETFTVVYKWTWSRTLS